MKVFLGIVSEIVDDKKFIIKFTIDNYIEDAIAYPIDTFDSPEVGEPVFVIEIESLMGFSFIYQKQRLFDHTRLKLKDSMIDIHEDKIEIETGKGISKMTLDSSGNIKLQTGPVEKPTSEISLNSEGNITIKSAVNITIDSKITTISGAGPNSAIPGVSGNLNCISVCPILGIPHGTKMNIKQ